MSIKPLANSRFGISTPILIDGVETFGLMSKFSFLDKNNLSSEQIKNISIDSKYAGSIDRLALDIYGSEDLHWVFVIFNHVANPLNWPPSGAVIQYPVPSVVLAQV